MSMKKKFQAFIFDMDGTIIDTAHIWDETNKIFLQKKGIADKKMIDAIIKEVHGFSATKVATIIKKMALLTDSIEEIIIQTKQIARELLKKEIQFIDGFLHFHDRLKNCGVKMAIATNADRDGLWRVNQILQLDNYFFEHMYCITCVNNVCKPLPDVYLHAAKQLGVSPKDCVAIEDSPPGVWAAKNAGMYCIAINTSKLSHGLGHADLIVDSYDDIPLNDFI